MIIAYTGTIGMGKTASAVRFLYQQYLDGKNIYANIKLNFPYTHVTYDMLKDYANNENTLGNAVMFIDEATIFLDSRRSGSKKNLLITYFLLQSRKKSTWIVFSVQFFGMVDLRLRNLTDDVVECIIKKTCSCKQDCQHIKVILNRHNIRKNRGSKIVNDIYIVNPFYSLYNTYEVVTNITKE